LMFALANGMIFVWRDPQWLSWQATKQPSKDAEKYSNFYYQ
jgi:hypothetical protein